MKSAEEQKRGRAEVAHGTYVAGVEMNVSVPSSALHFFFLGFGCGNLGATSSRKAPKSRFAMSWERGLSKVLNDVGRIQYSYDSISITQGNDLIGKGCVRGITCGHDNSHTILATQSLGAENLVKDDKLRVPIQSAQRIIQDQQ